VAEGVSGAVEGLKLDVRKGDRVRIVGTTAAGSLNAVFVRAM
jgi:ABC-type dipeptide/oligopeptide/nickel transport system ATPase component